MEEIRIGFIGAGANTRNKHIPGFQALDGVKLHAVANRTVESGSRVADEFGIEYVYEHWLDILDDDAIDAVCIGTWPYLHAAATCAALEAGKHVLCEARMAMNLADARRMLATHAQQGGVAMVVPSPFGLAGDQTMRRLLAEGFIGQPREISVRGLTSALADPTASLHWRQRADLSGVNVLALGILNETVQRWFGRTESVVAQAATFVPRRIDEETGLMQDVDVPDSIAVLARMATGATCVYHLSGHAHHAGPMQIEIFGSEGTLRYNLSDDTITGAGADADGGLETIPIPEQERGGWQVEADFIAAIRDGRPVRYTSFRDGIKYMAFTEAARTSAATGNRIVLDGL